MCAHPDAAIHAQTRGARAAPPPGSTSARWRPRHHRSWGTPFFRGVHTHTYIHTTARATATATATSTATATAATAATATTTAGL